MDKTSSHIYVDNDFKAQNLVNTINNLNTNDYISIDTEFIRVVTFYPLFSLLQLKLKDTVYIVDPKAIEIKDVLNAINNTKAFILMFACSEDLEILAYYSRQNALEKILPDRIYDVQLLCAFANLGYSLGLNSVQYDLLNIEPSEDCSRTDWEQRPLSYEQLSYASNDVRYLYDLYCKVKAMIDDAKFSDFKEEMDNIIQDAIRIIPVDKRYRYIQGSGLLSKEALTRLRYICMRRYKIACDKNIALNRIITNKALCQIAMRCPKSKKELLDVGVKPGCIRQWFDTIVDIVTKAQDLVCDENIEIPIDTYMHDGSNKHTIKRLKDLLKRKAIENKIAPELFTSRRYIQDFLMYKEKSLLVNGWRSKYTGSMQSFLK